MKEINIQPMNDKTGRSSRIFVGVNILDDLQTLYDVQRYSGVFVLTDKKVAPVLLDKVLHVVPAEATHLAIEPGESAKEISTVQQIWHAMHKAGCDRKSLLINLGGGVVCDMGGFAASTYMRGIDFINIPTTLLAQVDASVGGKTGIDFDGVKNLIGTFDQPQAVIIDPVTLKTLPQREFVAGFGEIIKHGLTSSRSYLKDVTSKPPLEFSATELEDIIAGSCRIKADIVGDDVSENGMRKVVNFGHTVGHAIEALSLETDRPLLHGEAVAIGMIVEADLSQQRGLLSTSETDIVGESIQAAGLPIAAPHFSLDHVMRVMASDKKNQHGQLRFTLLSGIGKAIYDQEVDERQVRDALMRHMEKATA